MSAPILSLPTELFESVARFACPRDLLAFRLASRAVQERTFDVFLDVHFSTYATLLSYEHSLRTLLAISSNVRFARAMKKIIFCTESMRPHMWRAYLPNLDEDKYHLRSRRRLFRKQKMLRMHNIDIELLARIFGNLIVIGNIVEVQVAAMHSDPSRPPLKPWGHHTISTLCDNPRILLDVFGDERPPQVLIRAMALSGFPVQKLSILHRDWLQTLMRLKYCHDFASASRCVHAGLTHFEMDFHLDGCMGGLTEEVAYATEVLESASSLQYLAIGTATTPSLRGFRIMPQYDLQRSWRYETAQHSAIVDWYLQGGITTLREVKLKGMAIDLEGLCSFAKRNLELRSLHLQGINLYCGDIAGPFARGAGDEERQQRETYAKSHIEETTGVEDVSLTLCDARNGEMPPPREDHRLEME